MWSEKCGESNKGWEKYISEYLFVENLRALAQPNDETFIASHKEIKLIKL